MEQKWDQLGWYGDCDDWFGDGVGTKSENFAGTGWGWGHKCVPMQLSSL